MKRLLLLLFIIFSGIIPNTSSRVDAQADELQNEPNVNDVVSEDSLRFSYEDESFLTILSAWQDIKIHAFHLLEFTDKATSEIYPAGEVLQLDEKLYSTGYIFIKRFQSAGELKSFNVQVDLFLRDSEIIINYRFISSAKHTSYGVSQEELDEFSKTYYHNMQELSSKFITYFAGMKRLAREYHNLLIEDN